MRRIPVHTIDDAPDTSQDLLASLKAKYGKVMNMHGEMAHAPTVIDLYVSAEDAIRRNTSLSEATRQAIHLAVATINDCGYCQAAYTISCERAGFTVEETLAIRQSREDEFDSSLAALLDVSREIAANKGYVDDLTWQTAIDAGWSGSQILEVFADTVRTILTNYFNHLAGTELDMPAAPSLGER